MLAVFVACAAALLLARVRFNSRYTSVCTSDAQLVARFKICLMYGPLAWLALFSTSQLLPLELPTRSKLGYRFFFRTCPVVSQYAGFSGN